MAEADLNLETGLLPLVDAWLDALPDRDRGSLLWVGRDEVRALRDALVGFKRLRELTAKDRMWRNLDAAEGRVTELEAALRECHQQMRQAVVLCDRGRPTMAAAILRACLRGPAGETALARSAPHEGERQESFCTGCGDRHPEPFCYG